jgi:hypothetical protein
LNKEVTVWFGKLKNAAVGFDVLTCQPSTVWCSRERLPAAAAQPAQGSSELVAPRIYFILFTGMVTLFRFFKTLENQLNTKWFITQERK